MKNNLQLHTEAIRLRRANGYGSTEPVDVEGLLLSHETYTLVRLPMTKHISGMCIIDGASRIVAVNSGMSLGRQRFTMAHELYHIEIEHTSQGVICKNGTLSDSEKEADQFASYFLLPYDALDWFIDKYAVRRWTLDFIIKLSQLFRMSFQAILFRLYQEDRITKNEYQNWMNQNVVSLVGDMGIDMTLYMKSLEDEQEVSYGQYCRLLEQARQRGRISESLYRQFATEGFCDERWRRLTREAIVYD